MEAVEAALTSETTIKSMPAEALDELWSRHHAQWRDSAQVTSHWDQANITDRTLLEFNTTGDFFKVLIIVSFKEQQLVEDPGKYFGRTVYVPGWQIE